MMGARVADKTPTAEIATAARERIEAQDDGRIVPASGELTAWCAIQGSNL
jgi:hypothetical protein